MAAKRRKKPQCGWTPQGRWRDTNGRWRDVHGRFTKPPRIPETKWPHPRKHGPTAAQIASTRKRRAAAIAGWECRRARERAVQRAARVRSRRRTALEAARNAPGVDQRGIKHVYYDPKTGQIVGRDALGNLYRAYRVRRPDGKWRTYWTWAEILDAYDTAKQFREQYESFKGYQIKIAW